ncbi:hypothetical protein ACTFIY_002974 [Dictyostelium cf. discoideum]
MNKWRTSIFINSKTKTDPIPITNGIFLGDSLCPLLFCLSINLIGIYISLINNSIVFTNGTILSHRLYIDDFKLYSNDGDSLCVTLDETLKAFKSIQMNANKEKSGIYLNDQNSKKCHHCQSNKAPFTILSLVDKETNTWTYPRDVKNENNQYTLETFCQTCILYFNKKKHLYEKRRKEKTINIFDHYDALEGIKNINENEPYKYMGVYFSPKLDLNVNRNNIHSKTIEKVKTLFNSELSGWNLASAFETLIVGYLRYYWFIDFSLKDVSALRKTIRDVMRQVGIVHISMSNDFLYLPRSLGGRGYIDIKYDQIPF